VNEKLGQLQHLSDKDREDILKLFTEMDEFMGKVKTCLANPNKFDAVSTTIDEIHAKLDQYKEVILLFLTHSL